MNALRARLRRLLRGPLLSALLRRCGIDARRFWLLMDLFDQLAEHDDLMSGLGRDQATLRAPALLYAAMTAILSLFLVSAALPAREYLRLFLFMSTLLLLVLLISETANSLVNPVEGLVLAHQPIDGATYTAAKLSHLARILLYFVPALNLIPACAGLALKQTNWAYPFLHLGAAFALGTLVALLCCAVFGWLVRIVPARRLKAAGHIVQLAPFVVLFGWRQIRQLFSRLDWPAFAAAHPAARAAVSVALALLALAAVVFGLRSLSADYLIRVSAIVHSSGAHPAAPRRPVRARLRLLRGPETRAGYFFTGQMALRDWQFRRQFFLMLPTFLPFVGALATLRSSPFGPHFSAAHLFPHCLGALVALVCALLVYTNDYKGAWVFLTAPSRALSGLARGVHALLWLWLVALPHLLLLASAVWFWGARDALLFTLYSAAVASIYLALDLRLIDGIPFSRAPEPQRAPIAFALVFVGSMVIGLAVALQYFLLFHSRLAVLAVTIAAFPFCLWFTRRSLASFTATMLFRLGVMTEETGALYHELAS
ncbi:MAG: hypothetical protein ABSC08_14710 [Bryobacteraceae bacterium]|jgi:hypothetical protein